MFKKGLLVFWAPWPPGLSTTWRSLTLASGFCSWSSLSSAFGQQPHICQWSSFQFVCRTFEKIILIEQVSMHWTILRREKICLFWIYSWQLCEEVLSRGSKISEIENNSRHNITAIYFLSSQNWSVHAYLFDACKLYLFWMYGWQLCEEVFINSFWIAVILCLKLFSISEICSEDFCIEVTFLAKLQAQSLRRIEDNLVYKYYSRVFLKVGINFRRSVKTPLHSCYQYAWNYNTFVL